MVYLGACWRNRALSAVGASDIGFSFVVVNGKTYTSATMAAPLALAKDHVASAVAQRDRIYILSFLGESIFLPICSPRFSQPSRFEKVEGRYHMSWPILSADLLAGMGHDI